MIRQPVSSPWAPAAGWRATDANPEISASISCSSNMSSHGSLRGVRILQGWKSKARIAGDRFIDRGVELHRARTKWVDGDVDRVVFLAHAGEVAHHVDFADLGPSQMLALKFVGDGVIWNAGGGEGDAAPVRAAKLEYRGFDGHSLRVPFLQVMPDA